MANKIAQDNDLFRGTMIRSPRHRIVLTESVSGLAEDHRDIFERLITAIREFKDFSEDNDPHKEHDFGSVDVSGNKYFWKIDYYDAKFEYGADPHEGSVSRLLTIMEASEY